MILYFPRQTPDLGKFWYRPECSHPIRLQDSLIQISQLEITLYLCMEIVTTERYQLRLLLLVWCGQAWPVTLKRVARVLFIDLVV